jgi:hypothetical protein
MHFRTFHNRLKQPKVVVARLTNTVDNHCSFGIKIAVLCVCVFVMFGGSYPPVQAQHARYQIQTVPVITTEDAVQDNNIAAINKHLQSTDDIETHNVEAIAHLDSTLSYMQGEERVVGGLLALLTGGGLFLQIRRRQI